MTGDRDMGDGGQVFLALGRLEGKVDALLRLNASQQDALKEHDARLRALEHGRAYLLGGSAVLGAVASVAVQFLLRTRT